MQDYKRLTEKLIEEIKNERGSIFQNCNECDYGIHNAEAIERLTRLAELEDKIENGTLKEVVRCKDCVYFQPEYVEMENKERRPYTEQEIKNGKFVSMEKGINCGSRCERFRYWDKNPYPVWFNENDFCSYGKSKAEAEKKLKELQEQDK